MKKRFLFFVVFAFAFFVSSVPAFALSLEPVPYDIPKTLLTAELVGDYLGGLFNSIRSIGNMGFIITSILVVVFFIPVYFRNFILKDFLEQQVINKAVGKKEFSRSVRAADRAKNREAIIDDRVAEMEINSEARKKFRALHPDADLEERLYQRELSYSAQVAFLDNHPELDKQKRRYRRK